MQVVFNHPLMYVIDYPAENAVEILDKRIGRVGFFRGSDAERFRSDFDAFLAEERDEEQLEDFIDAHSAQVTQPIRSH